MRSFISKASKPVDYSIVITFFLLLGFGFLVLASASSSLGAEKFGDSYYFLKHQLVYGFMPGLLAFLILTRVNFRIFKNKFFALGLLLLTLIFVVLVFTPLGITAKGATRWISLGPLTFQPAELLKISLIIYLASWLARTSNRQTSLMSGLIPFSVILGIVSVPLILQNSTAPVGILILVSLVMYSMSGARVRYVLGILLVGGLAVAIIVMATPYRAQRILTFLHPDDDIGAAGYHSMQAKTAIGAGGVTGVGLGQGAVKFNLPEPAGDSVFAVLAEEFGFVGVLALLGLFLFLILRMFLLSRSVRDQFGSLLLIGFGSLIATQTIFNIGAMSGVLPLSGTPLPFISYGGTQLAVLMAMIGVTVNISRYQ